MKYLSQWLNIQIIYKNIFNPKIRLINKDNNPIITKYLIKTSYIIPMTFKIKILDFTKATDFLQ